MATIPGPEQLLGLQPSSVGGAMQPGPTHPVPDYAGQALDQGLEDTARFLGQMARMQRESLFSEARAEALTGLEQLHTSLQAETDPATLGQKWEEGVARVRQKAAERLGQDEGLKQQFANDMGPAIVRMDGAMLGRASVLTRDRNRAVLGQELTASLGTLPAAQDSGAVDLVRANGLDSIARSRAVGALTEQEAAEQAQKFLTSVDTWLVARDINADPAAAGKALEDPGRYSTLNPIQREHFAAQARRDVEQRAAKARAEQERAERKAEQERARQARVLLGRARDMEASILEFGEEGPVNIEAGLRRLGFDEEADDWARTRDTAMKTYAVLRATDGMSFPEQARKVAESFPVKPGQKGAADILRARNVALQEVRQRYDKFKKDPAGYVARAMGDELSRVQDPAERARLSMEVQKELAGSEAAFHPRVLSEAEAKDWKGRYGDAQPEDKLKMLLSLDGFQEHAGQALAETGLSWEHAYAGSLAPQDPRLAQRVLSILAAKDQDMPGSQEDRTALRKEALTGFDTSDMGRVLRGQMALTGNAEYGAMSARFADLTARAAMFWADTGRAQKELWDGRLHALADDRLAYVWFPRSYDANTMEAGLRALRGRVKVDGPAELARDIATGGVWKNTPDGKGFILYDPVLGQPVAAGGKPVTVTLEQVMAAGSGGAGGDDALDLEVYP